MKAVELLGTIFPANMLQLSVEQRPDRVHAFERPVWREEDRARCIVKQDALEVELEKST
jgi:hypothetical protein